MKTISVYTRSGKASGSSYYRILQYQKDIDCKFKNRIVVPQKLYSNYNKSVGAKRKFYQVLFYFLAYVRTIGFLIKDIFLKPDVLFVSRAIMPKIMPFPIKPLMKKALKNAKKVVWDVDDDIFQSKEITKQETALLKEYSRHILVTTLELKKHFSEDKHNLFIHLPTTDGDFVGDDIKKLTELRKERYEKGEIALVWLATYTSLPFVEDVVPYLDEGAKIIKEKFNKQLVLEIVCNRPLEAKAEHLKIVNLAWTRELAHNRVQLAHAGIYPVRDTVQAQGKGAFKLLQYMSIALPSISSNVGNVKQIVENGVDGLVASCENLSDWKEHVVTLASSWKVIEEMGVNAKKTWETRYSYNENLKILTDIFCGETK